MKKARLAAAAAALALAGCPLPQPLPEYPEGQPVTPPRIVTDSVTFQDTVVRVPAGCATPPVVELGAELIDPDTVDPVEARWFVNYAPENQARSTPLQATPVAPDPDPLVIRRTVPTFKVEPYDFQPIAGPFGGASGAVHVVELVVSNGFLAVGSADATVPNRSAKPGYETQLQRWVLLTVPEGQASLPCP